MVNVGQVESDMTEVEKIALIIFSFAIFCTVSQQESFWLDDH
jgi:hypothetical protein